MDEYKIFNRTGERMFVPIWEKANLTVREAAVYFGIGEKKIRDLCNTTDCDFVLWVGNKELIKRRRMEEYLDKEYSI